LDRQSFDRRSWDRRSCIARAKLDRAFPPGSFPALTDFCDNVGHLMHHFQRDALNPDRLFTAVFILLCCSLAALCQTAPASPAQYSFTISAAQSWTDTGVDLSPGDTLTFTSEAKPGADASCVPQGSPSSSSDKLPLSDAPAGALIAKLSDSAAPALVGSGRDLHSDAAGHLFLGLNQTTASDCAFAVKVSITHAATDQAAQPHNMKAELSSAAKVWLQGQLGSSTSSTQANALTDSAATTFKAPTATLDSNLRQHLDGVPRRVHDHLGNLGDMVNFVIVGSQENVQAALDAADWHVADLDSKEAGLKAIMDTYEKQDYLQMPMSHLYLFDRMQDFGYEQAQAFAVVATRHHFRLWKTPFTWNDEPVWVGAGTHDIGFEKDIRTGKLTHKIDPDVDLERENIAQSLDKSGKAKTIGYYLPPNPVQDAKNASGGGYHSDGRLLVVFLK
jgi:hypothetical protein